MNYLLEMPRFHVKMRLKSVPQKTSDTSQYSCFSKILQNLKHFLNSRVIV